MAEVLAGLLVSSLVSIAKHKLGSAIKKQASLLWKFDDYLEEMEEKLEYISAVLEDAERRSVEDKLVQLWLKRLKDAALDISDMLEDYQDTSDQGKAKMPGVVSCLPMTYNKIPVANKMKSLREKLRKIEKEIAIFDFKKSSGTTNDNPHDDRETISYLPEQVVGRDREKQEIINILSVNTSNDDEIVIVAIYGLGGMGKSTLAQLIYNDAQFKKYDYRIWVYVSQDFSLKRIGSSIIFQLPTQGQQYMGAQQTIKQHLDKLLHGKTVLVVLDDLWEENMTELRKLRMMLHVKGSKVDVIVTTRKKEIAMEVSTGEPYNLQNLEDDKCWEIIKRSSNFEHNSNQEKMEKVGLEIAKKCGGVALAAHAVGFILRSINDLYGWTEINNSDIWNRCSKASDVLPSLKLSYQRMPPHLRICFSYCAIFPKGHNIIEDDLIQQWKALDLVEQSKGKEYINKLLGMSFLQVSKLPSTSQDHVGRYTMHALVHDLARSTATDDMQVLNVAPQKNTRDHKYCRYSLLRKYDQTMKLTYMPSKLRALRFSESGHLSFPSGAFSFAKYLRTLDFSECSGIFLPTSIGRVKQLRCLIAPRIKNYSLPECITELSKLQYLNINESSQISVVPESIGNLGFLNHLCLSGCSGISKLPLSFGDLTYMVHLDMSGCSGLTELPDSLGNLTHLQHLELSGCSMVKAIPESLCGLTQLQYLNLSSCAYLEGLPEGIGSLVGMQYLNMSGCVHIRGLPQSMMELQSLAHLNLSGCRRMRRGSLACLRGLTALQHLDISHSRDSYHNDLLVDLPNVTNNLKYLSLSHCCTLRYFTSHHKDLLDDFIASLTVLEHLDLSRNFKLAYLPKSIGNLKRLHTLDLSYCSNLMGLPESICTLSLQSLLLDGCSDAVLDQARSLMNYSQTLPVFKVRADDVSNGCRSNLHLLQGVHVSELRIRCLENVRSLEEAKKVGLSDKHNLSKLTLAWSTMHKGAVQILEDQDLLEQLVPPTGLKSVSLEGYSGTSFPGWLKDISGHLTNLVSMQLSDLPTCSNLPPLGQLRHLEKLSLWKLPGIKRIESGLCGGKGAFRRLSSFSITWMESLEEWSTTYSVEDGVEEFMFPVLDLLQIQGCPRLKLKPCPPTFRECYINGSGQVISSLEAVFSCSSSSSPAVKLDLDMVGAMKLDLDMVGDSCQSMRLFHHFPAIRELRICGLQLKSVPESMRHLSSLESLTLQCCYSISALPEWLGDLSSLKTLVIFACHGIRSLPACILQQFTKLKTLEISYCPELKKWCESEENKIKLAHINIVRIREEWND